MKQLNAGLCAFYLILTLGIALVGSAGLGLNQPAQAASATELNTWTQETLTDFRKSVPDADKILAEAKGVLVFPRAYNAGFLFGGKYAEGELLVDNAVSGYYNLVGLSWGWQIGGQRQSLVIAFMTHDALMKFRNSQGWDLGTDATVAVIDAGLQGSVSVSRFNKPVMAFALNQKGLMAGLSLQGSKVSRISK
jgi:lipid-binding SYLF domain-containing protein